MQPTVFMGPGLMAAPCPGMTKKFGWSAGAGDRLAVLGKELADPVDDGPNADGARAVTGMKIVRSKAGVYLELLKSGESILAHRLRHLQRALRRARGPIRFDLDVIAA